MKKACFEANFLSVSLVALLLLSIGARTSVAQECYSDDDCGEHRLCDLPPSGMICTDVDGVPVSCETVEPTPGECEFGLGTCQQDADCDDGYYCEKGDSVRVSMPTCSADGPCIEPGTVEEVDTEGRCEPAQLECEIDSDCPSPLSCQVFTDEECTYAAEEETCEQKQFTYCSFTPIECEADTDCDTGYECALVESRKKCTGSIESAPSLCAPGEPCEPISGAEPIEEQCVPIQEWFCFPKRVNCESDRDCSNGWICVDFSETLAFGPDYDDGEYAGPEWWQQEGESKAVACMPEGIIALLNGQVQIAGSSYDNASDANESTTLESSSGPITDVQNGNDANEQESSADGMGSCGCSVTPKPLGSAYGLAVIALVLAFRRRHRARW